MTGQYHDVRIERFDQGRQLKMTVDEYEPQVRSARSFGSGLKTHFSSCVQVYNFHESLKASADAQFNNIQYLYIGRNETMREGFVGCISRVEFDEIIPLKLLFQVRKRLATQAPKRAL